MQLAPGADLVALVKPMFELALAEPPSDPAEIARAVDLAAPPSSAGPWTVVATIESPVTGAHGAVEHLLHARRRDPTRRTGAQVAAASPERRRDADAFVDDVGGVSDVARVSSAITSARASATASTTTASLDASPS